LEGANEMKILFLLKRWPGGVGVVVKTLKKEFEKKGHEVTAIAREEDLKIYSLIKSIFPIRRLVRKKVKEEGFDIIYTKDWSMAFPLIFPYPIFRKKHYCGFGGLQNERVGSILQRIVGTIIGRRIICYGDPVKRAFPKANQIFNGVDLDKFKPNPKIKRIKNSVGFANWKTDIYNYEKVREAVEKCGKKFMVAEGVPPEGMSDFYNQIETFISLPPPYTGFNLVWVEAMACGVPKIIGSNAGIGNRLPIDKIENFESIEGALENAVEKDYRKLLDDKFSWKRNVEEHLKLWKK